jgi:hypothetical protein
MTMQTPAITTAKDQRAAYTTPTVTRLCLIETAVPFKSGAANDFATLITARNG